ncbi:dTDP-4-amino-4,6-dideoxygalactose transaminase [Haloactinospora alba]|uniref:dTDP-4-amino-4,6-dideoxygalactose transaminase n=1 Tax=Haloactinospora alba TaxID=405555 RepID=A0A543N966_9ACTN|nr:DegT/DnrJ/EryC1/StrS family aminotransferase [Haloactinospora alba]TQN28372.1 dTDP-4-amino-4,6-dideoxygalactose transaminase [Haloactinospora alba]
MSALAMLGGARAVPRGSDDAPWPVVTSGEEQAVLRVLRNGRLTATAAGETEVPALEQAWAQHVGVAHCAAVASGTAALHAALAALGVGAGDEVILPALTMNATAHAVRQRGAAPVFADIEPDTLTLDPRSVRAALTPRSTALLPVHLHGLPADMDGLNAAAREHHLPVVEDAAQAHGASYRGTPVGGVGTLGCFSLHPSKNLPSCGEGGLVTTDSTELHRAVTTARNFGEAPPTRVRTYLTHRPGGNARLSPVQAAFARSQLDRFPDYAASRERAAADLCARLARLPGLRVPHVPPDRTHAWHIIRLRLAPAELGIEDTHPAAVREAFHRALRAEGVPVSQYQTAPLPAHPAFRAPDTSDAELAEAFPVSCAAVDDSLCLQRRHLGPDAATVLPAYAEAFEKVWHHRDLVLRMARARPRIRDWRDAVRGR